MCFLCTQCTDNAPSNIKLGSREAGRLRVAEIIEKHFWLRLDNVSGHVCAGCWKQLLAFHNFYLSVEHAHKTLLEQQTTPNALQEKENAVESGIIKQELLLDDSVAGAVKRRRGRPRKQQPAADEATGINSSEFKAVLEQINLNEIKIEFPEADLSIADVLQDQEEMEEEQNSSSDEAENADEVEQDDEAEEVVVKPRKRITKRKTKTKTKTKKLRCKKTKTKKTMTNVKTTREHSLKTSWKVKSSEFNAYIKDHFKVHCPLCKELMAGFSELLVHSRDVHNIPRGYAVCCNRKFWKRGVLVDHLRRHQDPDLFKCHICQRVMGHRRSLELHMRMHDIKTRGRNYQCDQCPKKFFSSVVCNRHKLTHIPKEQWHSLCTTCNKTFPTEYVLQQHVKLVHLRTFDKICDVCGKSVRGREALVRHMEEHEGMPQRTIQCHLCDSKLTTKYGLARHIKMMHIEENRQPMQCEYCLKISPSLQSHQHHIKYTHNTARKHQCPMCDKAFKRPSELREHMTTHTGEVLYTCPHCPKTFNSNANMHAHRKKMHFKEWQMFHRHQHTRTRTMDTIIAVSVRKTTERTVEAAAASARAAAVIASIANPETELMEATLEEMETEVQLGEFVGELAGEEEVEC